MNEFLSAQKINAPIKKVLVLGSGALKIGEAGEFDFSGSQALKALRESGIETVLVNPNIATIQTDPSMASKIYLLPIEPESVERVIKKERPDSILLNVGGQTALNCGVALNDRGILSKYGIRVLGTSIESIRISEDRRLFKQAMEDAGLKVCKSAAANSVDEAISIANEIGYPLMLRSGFTLGGAGSGIAKNEKELIEIADVALNGSPIKQVLIEECVGGWKEIEYEIIRDKKDNCIIICNMENFDPVGIHTGESIVVAPSQTLNNVEYHALRSISIAAARKINIIGECNIQFAVNPDTFDYRIIEVNPRLSRSSALASKATGYPIASVATKLCIGMSLDEIKNAVTQATYACFEPALDYIVAKIPRWDFKKFRGAERFIGTQMKSVGEVMAIGRNFEEAIQKASRMCDPSRYGVVGNGIDTCTDISEIEKNLSAPTDLRLFYIAAAIKSGLSLERINKLTKIDLWFLNKLKNIIELEKVLKQEKQEHGLLKNLLEAKKLGFSDAGIAKIRGLKESEIRKLRIENDIVPHVRQIDTLAAEWPSKTNYLYLTYCADDDDIDFSKNNEKEKIIVLGSGPYSIGSSVEFDWCSVHGIWGVKKSGKEAIMINCNPETVSTDYDISDKLYFEDINLETVLDICDKENPLGAIVSFGGQRPNNIAVKLHESGVRILGTSSENIDRAEDRSRFSALLDELEIKQPAWCAVETIAGALEFAENAGYPVIVRPSYVLSGAAMKTVHSENELEKYIDQATEISSERPVVISKFISNAREIEVDGVSDGKRVLIGAIAEHIENAGVHSGDATIVIPTRTVKKAALEKIEEYTKKIAEALEIKGPFNIQYLVEDGKVFVIECNLRASRSMPFVSKTVGVNLIEIATNVILGQKLSGNFMPKPKHFGVKVPQFSFMRISGADPLLGIEMASTGEVACIGFDFNKTLIDAMRSAQFCVPVEFGRVLISASESARPKILEDAKLLSSIGFEIYGTLHTSEYLKKNGVDSIVLKKISEGSEILEHITQKKIDLVINIPHETETESERHDGYILRRATVNYGIPLITNPELAHALVLAIKKEYEKSKLMELGTISKIPIESLQEIVAAKGSE
ncbi:MAG: carbamoyl-phosphate synthase (glutamine-hydrolyzing) large subunit [Nanoarchaeota archaeon]|nr:carbamoyl-phosphate synthase (glutamine-hydrolyzing) large subunit [Nanoarchaeota archaeon]